MLERNNNVLKGHVLSFKYRLLAVLFDRHLDCGRRCRFLREQRLATAIDGKGQKRMAFLLRHRFLVVLSIVLSATKFESPVCEGGLMGSRFENRGLGAIEADERGGTEAGAAGGVGCFDVGSFCEIAGRRSAGSNGVISSEATSVREASACLRAFCCGTFSLWLLSIVLSANEFDSPVCEGGLMGRRFKNRGVGSIEADERGGAEADAAGEVGCFDVGGFCDGAGYRSADSNGVISSMLQNARRHVSVALPLLLRRAWFAW